LNKKTRIQHPVYSSYLCKPMLAPPVTWSGTLDHPLDCMDDQGGLLDRVIQLAELIYQVSKESCHGNYMGFRCSSPTLQYVVWYHNHGRNECMPKSFPIPSSKSEMQQVLEKWLLHSVLMLVQSWIKPLVYLQTTLGRYNDAPVALLSKTKWVSDKLLRLEQGVVVLIRKMLDKGALTATKYDRSPVSCDTHPEIQESILKDYTVLSSFKKDTHKMETFLKLLKCRQTDKFVCADKNG
uniref:Somatolactin alpha n=1 Tax=Paramormyrops kingsleyae TaxID=1676925 RepID=A0A3B3T7X9_9TELE